jgi:hypothetical protein
MGRAIKLILLTIIAVVSLGSRSSPSIAQKETFAQDGIEFCNVVTETIA